MLNDDRSHGLWEKTAPPAPETQRLRSDLSVDVAIVGAGFTGLSAALHLAEAGAKVAVLDAAEIGFGGSGRNVGLVNAGMWVMPDDLPKVLGSLHGERLLQLLGDAPKSVFHLVDKHGIECELERNGTLHCAVGESGLRQLEERTRQWQARAADVTLLDAAETAARVGSGAYAGSLLDRRAGTIQPLAYVRGLARAAMAAGAAVHTDTRVTATEKSGDRWLVRTPEANVTADWIVMATNAYTTAPWPQLRAEIVHLPYFNFATKPLTANLRKSILPERQGAWDTKEILSSFRMDKAGRLVFGSVGALRGTGMAVHRAWAARSIRKLFPQLGEIEFEAGWYGKIGMTSDHLPRFHVLAPKIISFNGYNGRGIAPGTVFGRVLAEHITGTTTTDELPLPVSAPGDEKFRSVKEGYYEAGSQVAHLVGNRF
ncbi:FAD-binding oxidoreductase [Phyllobacterium sp. 0TCS1.6C]|uniref:NAD(P)/FAD-dependent oxidoreductase n=1 Tax=unclassified Phyllobacterium TaxID=2638441 RepID=UPI002264F12B|nr:MULTISPECIES: FAD-binding oxidoreductase [unclassified Phyllobacterium]MCX8281787.1 FAD-binding oxidoreductase [Phyllobacterium sp. 0TCS1.6C]MCX8295322.1 FAD-binding oxidoreductase [Phyllobacterium sp. 0TCS1.6A]